MNWNAWSAIMSTLYLILEKVETLDSCKLGKISSAEDAAYGACKEEVLGIIETEIEKVRGWAKE